jgi:hypothetical protein
MTRFFTIKYLPNPHLFSDKQYIPFKYANTLDDNQGNLSVKFTLARYWQAEIMC